MNDLISNAQARSQQKALNQKNNANSQKLGSDAKSNLSSHKCNNQLILKAEKEIKDARQRIKKTADQTGSQGQSAFSKVNSYFDADPFP